MELATTREVRRIQAEQTHPSHTLLPDSREYPYEHRQNYSYTALSTISDKRFLDSGIIYTYLRISKYCSA
jgi:hypothetical protein